MKKVLLGLILSAGISGMAMANDSNINISEKSPEIVVFKNELGNVIKKQIITYNYKDGVLTSCTIATHTYVYDICGKHVSTFRESYEAFGSACTAVGLPGGGLYIKVERINNGFGDCHPEHTTDIN